MRKIQFYCSLLAFCVLLACGSKKSETETIETEDEINLPDENKATKDLSSIKLTDDLMKNYMAIVPKLKEKGALLSPDMGNIEGLYQYNKMEGVIKDGGFKDFNCLQFCRQRNKRAKYNAKNGRCTSRGH